MKIGSLFSGIGGFDLGFERAGFEVAWQVEIEDFPRKILARHFPNAQRFTDVREVGRANLKPVDVICAGVPCQDVSIAGKREGLSGKRTGLFYEFARILQELRPTWFVFENVPGFLSSNKGRDFAEILRVLMVECGYGVSWRVLNSQFFGVAQRRRRLFIVGCLGKPCPTEILFEPKGSARNSETRGEAWPHIAVPLTSGIGITGNAPGRRKEDDFNLAISESGPGFWREGIGPIRAEGENRPSRPSTLIASTLRASDGHHGRSSPRGDGCDNLIPFDTTQITSAQNYSNPKPGDPCHPLASGAHPPAVAFTLPSAHRGIGNGHNTNYVPCADALDEERSSKQQQQPAPQMDGAVLGDDLDSSSIDSDRMRDFAGLPKGMDSPRYRALGNAVTVQVIEFIAGRILLFANTQIEQGEA